MTLISSKILMLQSILRLNCKALLRCPVAAIIHNNPWRALQSSLIQKHESTKIYFEQAILFSTDTKKAKKNKNDDGNIKKIVKSSLEKTSRRYTKEQDELILARVKELGYDNPETWKSLAKDFNIKQPHNIKRRCDLLLSRGTGTPQRRTFTKEEDALILRKVEEMGYDNIETWKTLAHELNRDPTPRSILIIKGRYNLISNREIQEKKRFTEEDGNFILSYVEKNGESKKTWEDLATRFGMNYPFNVEKHYHGLLKKCVRGKFTKAEDQIILNDVKLHGESLETYKTLGEKLNRFRFYHNSIRARFEYLQNKPSKKHSNWGIDEDKMLMEYIFQVDN